MKGSENPDWVEKISHFSLDLRHSEPVFAAVGSDRTVLGAILLKKKRETLFDKSLRFTGSDLHLFRSKWDVRLKIARAPDNDARPFIADVQFYKHGTCWANFSCSILP